MITVKGRYNGKVLPVFDNMDEAMEYFGRRRKIVYSGMNALYLSISGILGISQVLFKPSLAIALTSVVILTAGYFYCLTWELNIRTPKQFKVFYSEEDKKWLLFPVNRYPAVAFVLENEYDTIEEGYTIEDYVKDVFERELKKSTIATRFIASGLFLSAVLLPAGSIICLASAIGAVVIGMVILCW